MYNADVAFRIEMLQPSRTFECKVTIGNKIYTNADVISINIDGNLQGGSSYTIGNAISQSCDIVFRNNGNVVIDSDVVNVEIGLLVNGAFEYVQMGVFNVDDYSQNDFTITIKCFDNMIKLEKKFTTAITTTTTANTDLLNEVITQTGVSLDTSIAFNSILVPTKEYTCREIVSYIASASGYNAIIGRNGKLKFIGLTSSNTYLTKNNYFEFELDKNQFIIKKLTCKVGNDELTLGSTTDTTMELKIENPLMTQDAMETAYNAVSAISFMGYSSKWQGNLYFDLGDILTIKDTKNVYRNVPILSQKLTYTGGLTSSISAKGENKIANSYSSYGKQYYDMSRLQMDTGNLRNDITILRSDTDTLKSDTDTLKGDTKTLQDKMNIAYLASGENMIENGDFDVYIPTMVDFQGNKGQGTDEVMTFRSWDSASLSSWKQGIRQGISPDGENYFLPNWYNTPAAGYVYYVPIWQIVNYPYIETNNLVLLSYLSYYGNTFYYNSTFPPDPESAYVNVLICIDKNGVKTYAKPKEIKCPSMGGYGEYQTVFTLTPGTIKLKLIFAVNLNFNTYTLAAKLDKVCLTTASPYKPSQTDTNKAIAEVATNVNKKVDKVEGKGLSTNDYSGTDKTKLDNVATGATKVASSTTNGNIKINDTETPVYAHPGTGTNPHGTTKADVSLGNVPNVDTNSQTPTYTESSTLETITTGEYLTIAFGKIKKAINILISHIANVANPHSVTKAQIGLGSADNTSDVNKPISTATQTALNLKANASQVLTNVPSGAIFTDTVTTINSKTGAIAKADIVALGIPAQDTVYVHPTTHPPSIIAQDVNNRFVSDAEKSTWNGKASLLLTQLFTQEQHFTENGIAYSDPRPGYGCAIKATGDIATTSQIWATGNINTTGGQVKVGGNPVYHVGNKPSLSDLGVGIGGITGCATRVHNDLNTVWQSGWYDGQNLVNAPFQGWIKIFVINNADANQNYVTQMAWGMIDHVNEMYMRSTVNGVNWTVWEQIAKFGQAPTPTIYALSLLAGWSRLGVYGPGQYYRDMEGRVHLRGTITGGIATSGTILFVLPEGYRPIYTSTFLVLNSDVQRFATLYSNGSFSIGDGFTSTYLSLDGLIFDTF